MAWKEETMMSQKQAFIEAVQRQTQSFAQHCRDFQISRQTGYKTLNLYKLKGMEGLMSLSRTPHMSPNKTSLFVEKSILSVRVAHPTWGARKIHAVLDKVLDSPSISTISSILKRNGFIQREESLKRKKLIRFEREQPNDLWQMDFKGKFLLENHHWCFPLTILDDCARFLLGLKSCSNERKRTVYHYLSHVFKEYGLPLQMNVDNGNPWGNSRLFPHTELTVWLMRLGIKVTHSRPKHPQTNGKIERLHRTLKNDVLDGQRINHLAHAQRLFNEWRHIYNHERPHEALGMKVPAQRYQSSRRRMPNRLPPIEYKEGAIVKKVRGNGGFYYGGKEYMIGRAFSGLPVEVKVNELTRMMEVYFNHNRVFISNLA